MKSILFPISVLIICTGCSKDNDQQGSKVFPERKVKDTVNINSDKPHHEPADKTPLKTISSSEIRQHIGDSLNVEGYVAEVYFSDKVAYLNMENKFPKNTFSCAVFAVKFDEFGDLSKYKGKKVLVTGKVSTFKNKIQLILNSRDQLKIIQ